MENGKNISSAPRKFNVDRKRIRERLKQEESLVNQKRGSRSNGRDCTSRFPLMEQALYNDHKKARDEGNTIKRCLIADIINREKFSGRNALWDYMGGVTIGCLPS